MSSHDAYYEQAPLLILPPSISQPRVYDPYWDEITKEIAPEHTEDKWNPADFGGTSFKAEGDQLTIFYDNTLEPPDPDDFNSIEEFEKAWSTWESVREQVKNASQETAPEHICNNNSDVTSTTSQLSNTGVREQVQQSLQVAPEHMRLSSDEDTNKTACLLPSPQYLVNSHTSNNNPKQEQVNHWVERYWVKRAGTKHYYYRYCWMSGRKINRVHIGAIGSTIATRKKQEVQSAINRGDSPSQIIQLIKEEKQ